MSTTVGRLVRTELKLMTRDPLVLTFVFAFPIVTMLIIGGAFATDPDPASNGINPAHWYVASYLTVVIAATGLVMLPVHLASYRERGVLRRFAAAGVPRCSFAAAQLIVGVVTTAVACGLLLAVAAPVYGIPAMHDWWRVAVALPLGAVAFLSLGVLLGSLLPSARAAQAIGLLLFFPSFLLGAGGPPPPGVGSGGPRGGRPAAADHADQRGAGAVAGPGLGHRVAGRGGGAGRGGHRPGGPPDGLVTTPPVIPWTGRGRRGGRSIRDMSEPARSPQPGQLLPGWARWAALAVFAAFIAVGVARLNPDPAAAAVAALVSVAAAAALVLQWGPLLVLASIATAGVAVLGHGMSSNIGWFAVCLLAAWCVLIGGRRDGLIYLAGVLALFAGEWLWVTSDPGWGAWMAGTTLPVLAGLLIRHEIDLVFQLRAAQAGLAERARSEERNRIA